MPVKTNIMLGVDSYDVFFTFLQSTSAPSDRVAVIVLYDANKKTLAILSFYIGMTSFTVTERIIVPVKEQIEEFVDIFMSSNHFNEVYQVLRGEKPLYIAFSRDGSGVLNCAWFGKIVDKSKVLNNVWFGTSSNETVGEEEGKGT